MNLEPIIASMLDTATENNAAPDDYINPADGLHYCGKCHTPKEAYFENNLSFNGRKTHYTPCKCQAEEIEQREAEKRDFERRNRIHLMRSEAFADIPAASWQFDNPDILSHGLNDGQKIAKRYADRWEDAQEQNLGLCLFGNVGTGKSYTAGCIANALIDRQYSVLFVRVTTIVNQLQGLFNKDREHYIKSLMRPDLLIMDDLGAERSTSFGKECVFDVIDRRVLSGKPLIITTNIPLHALKNATDTEDRRIYDRLLTVCAPVEFKGENHRKAKASDKLRVAAEILSQ